MIHPLGGSMIRALTNVSPFPSFDIFIFQSTGSPGIVFFIVSPGSVDIIGTYPGVIVTGKVTLRGALIWLSFMSPDALTCNVYGKNAVEFLFMYMERMQLNFYLQRLVVLLFVQVQSLPQMPQREYIKSEN